MSMITCKFCNRVVDEDFNVEHENECRIEKVWDELMTKLIELNGIISCRNNGVNMNELKDKAISIKGKQYILVSDRVLHFNEIYPNGSISTELVSGATDDMVVIKATVLPDCSVPNRVFTGYSQATWGDGYINKTSALENCETSAVGRALGFMGIGVIDSIASVDEINKATQQPPKKTGMATEGQRKFITDLMRQKSVDISTVQKEMNLKEDEKMTFDVAREAIEWLKGL